MSEPGGPLLRQARAMAIATVASRVTGFARIAALTAVLGLGGLRQAFEVANTLPNTLFELLLGGVLSSTLVPLLVEARSKGQATAFAQRILTVTLLFTAGLSVLGVVAAPLLVRAYNHSPQADEIALSIQWARFFLPQMLFYALTAIISAVLNTHGRFAAAAWAPVLNNVIVIGTLGVFVALPGTATVATLTTAQLVTLGIGTSLGVVAMAAALLPALRATGFRWRLRLDLRGVGLRRMARMGSWVLLYVAATQLSYWVVTGLATAVQEQPTYLTAFTVWQLPHAVVAVSIITALLPRMSAHAVAGRTADLRAELDRGLRISLIVLVPAVVAFVVLGRVITTVLFAHGATSTSQAERVGWVLAVFAVGLLPFSVYQLQARAFYALRDTRTPALVQCAVSAVLIGVDVGLTVLLPAHQRVFGLAAGHACAYVVGVVVSAAALHRRLGARSSSPGPMSLIARLVPAGLVSGLAVVGLMLLLPHSAVVRLLAGGALLVLVYVAAIVVLRVPEASVLSLTRRRPG